MNKLNSLKDWRPPLSEEGEPPSATQTPLDRYSITFKTDELEQLAQSPTPGKKVAGMRAREFA
jgi:hypothetical protein